MAKRIDIDEKVNKNRELRIGPCFFKEDCMVILRRRENGPRAIILYIRMFLESRKTHGFIYKKSGFAMDELISVLYDEEIDEVDKLIESIESVGLLEKTQKGYLIKPVDSDRNRMGSHYKSWVKAVFERDKYTCQKCKVAGGRLNAHHIVSWKLCVESRFDVDNGVTLCERCHKNEHRYR